MSVVSTRKRTSYLWNYFEKLDQKFATCDLCKGKLSYRTSTTNLRKHMELRHGEEWAVISTDLEAYKIQDASLNASTNGGTIVADASSSTTPSTNLKIEVIDDDILKEDPPSPPPPPPEKEKTTKKPTKPAVPQTRETPISIPVQTQKEEFAAFGNFIALQMQNLPLEVSLQLQSDIQSLVTQTRLNYLREMSANSTPDPLLF